MKQIRLLLAIFITGLVLSGLTAIPLQTELNLLAPAARRSAWAESSGLAAWLDRVQMALTETNAKYPFIAYGTDWLAFAHVVIAIAFIGPWRDPVKNIWVIEFGMIACVLVIPLALGMGAVRGIPFGWRMIDCSFGAGGLFRCGCATGRSSSLRRQRDQRRRGGGLNHAPAPRFRRQVIDNRPV